MPSSSPAQSSRRPAWAASLGRAALIGLGAGVAVGLLGALLPPRYRSEAALLPLSRQDGRLPGLASQLLARLPVAERSVEETDREVILAFLQSRALKERLLARHDLLPGLYPERLAPDGRTWRPGAPEPSAALAIQDERLDDVFRAQSRKRSPLIVLSWEAADPGEAAVRLEQVIEELRLWLRDEHVTQARSEREFVQGQFEEAARTLADWERRLPSADVPLSRIEREVAAGQGVYAELKRQLALAGINEARQRSDFRVLDAPFRPVRPCSPRPWLAGALAGAAVFCLALLGLSLGGSRARSDRPDDRPGQPR